MKKNVKPKIKTLSVALLSLALLVAVASCSGRSDAEDAPSSENVASTTERANDEDAALAPEDARRAQVTPSNATPPATLSPDPAFDHLFPTLRQMTTAPIMLPASHPPKVVSVAIEQDPNENPYTTGGDRYTILLLHSDPGPDPTVRPHVHYATLGRLTASPASAPMPDPTNGLGAPQRLEDLALPDGTVVSLERVEPPRGANHGPFTVGTFEEAGYRYTVLIENDSPGGNLTRQILSTMARVPDS
jgi:hypothetical protein